MIGVNLPALVTVVRLPYEPRYPTLKSKLAAKKKEIKVLSEEDLSMLDYSRCRIKGSPTKVKKTYTATSFYKPEIVRSQYIREYAYRCLY